jgi:hypothetical protein
MTTNRAPMIRLIFLLCAVSFCTARAQSPNCSIEQSNVQIGFPAQGGDVIVGVTTSDPACELKIIRSDTWFTTSLSRTGPTVWSVTFSAGPAGIGATYGVYFNCCGTFYYNRVGSVDFNYQGSSAPFTFGSINVLQEGFPDCTFSIDPTVKTFGPDDGKGVAQQSTVQVTAKSNSSSVPLSSCIWPASTPDKWITLKASSGTGNGTLAYTVDPNPGPARNGLIKIANRSVQINQSTDPVELVGMEVTQTVQNLYNEVPLFEGKPAYIRAFVRRMGTGPRNFYPKVTASGPKGTTELQPVYPLVKIPTAIARDSSPSGSGATFPSYYLFAVPPQYTSGTVSFKFDSTDNLDTPKCSDPAETPMIWVPGLPVVSGIPVKTSNGSAGAANDCLLVQSFQKLAPVFAKFFLVTSLDANNQAGTPTPADGNRIRDQLEATLPISVFSVGGYTYPGLTAGQPWKVPFDDLTLGLLQTLRRVDCGLLAKLNDSSICPYYVGILKGFPVQLGGTEGITHSFDAMWVYSDAPDVFTPSHEAGHLAGRKHVLPCAPGGVTCGDLDPNYPYSATVQTITGGVIGGSNISNVNDPAVFFGFDGRAGATSNPQLPGLFDVMSYSRNPWFSDYTNDLVWLGFGGTLSGTQSSNAAATAVTALGEVAIVTGVISITAQTGSITRLVRLPSGAADSGLISGSWSLRLSNAQQALATYSFEPEPIPDSPSMASFAFTIPWVSGATKVSLFHNSQLADSRTASANPPTISLTAPNGGQTLTGTSFTASWAAADIDKDPLTYSVLYSVDAGTTWQTLATDLTTNTFKLDLTTLRGSTQALLRVLASDGFYTTQAQSTGMFTVAKHAPTVTISAPATATAVDPAQSIVFQGSGYDVEDGTLADASLTWSSDLSGTLGTGRFLVLNAAALKSGAHTITLTGKDSDAQTGTASITVTVACGYGVNRTALNYSHASATDSLAITAPDGCKWTAVGGSTWLTVKDPAYGSGVGTVSLSVAANNASAPRATTLTAAGTTVTVFQDGGCSYSLPVASAQAGAAFSSSSFSVTKSDASCAVTPSSSSAFISIVNTSLSGVTATVSYQVAANTSTSARSGQITVGDQTFTVNQAAGAPDTTPPFGSFDTPANGIGNVVGAVGVTGWALDNIGVSKVQIYRDPLKGEQTGAFGWVYIGDAVFVAGARPDVQGLYPNFPNANRAGWGYQLLTNFLPGSGNGTFKLHAVAYDASGNTLELSAPGKTITCTNNAAAKPFGTIDTPGQGATVSGSAYVNFGWALTPGASFKIPTDGSTISVVIDGVPGPHPTYNQARSDIATLFAGYTNSANAIGFYYLDTTKLPDGVHTISWNVFDNAGRGEGLGSRFFTVANGGSAATAVAPVALNGTRGGIIRYRTGHDLSVRPRILKRSVENRYLIQIGEMDRLELHLPVGTSIADPPPGSTLDTNTGIFYWGTAPGLLGRYELIFNGPEEIRVAVTVGGVPALPHR